MGFLKYKSPKSCPAAHVQETAADISERSFSAVTLCEVFALNQVEYPTKSNDKNPLPRHTVCKMSCGDII